MENQPLISVIVPVYKVEAYLDRCVESIINQTYKNLEIILVDDGSPDECPKMCDSWKTKDNRIKVIHKQNGGLSDARNAGIKKSTGEYISFIDSDDYVTVEFINTLFQTLNNNDSDIVECDVIRIYEDGTVDEYTDGLQAENYSTIQGLSALISETVFRQHVWNKLYRTELVKEIPFAVGKQHEDEFWTYQVFGKAKSVTKISKSMYYYFQRTDSIMGEQFNLRRLDALEGKSARQDYIESVFPELKLLAKEEFYISCIFAYQCTLKYLHGIDKRSAKAQIYEYKNKSELSFSEINAIQSNNKKYYYLSKISFYLCCKLRAIFNIGF